MKIKKYRSHIVTFIAGVLIATASTSYAAVGDKVEAIFADFNLIVNGQPQVLQETPLVVNGTSYLPLRSLSNLLGYDVTYKSDSRTIELNSGVTSGVYGVQPSIQTAIPVTPIPTPSPTPDPMLWQKSSANNPVAVDDNRTPLPTDIYISYRDLPSLYKLSVIFKNGENSLYVSNGDNILIILIPNNLNLTEGQLGVFNTNKGLIHFKNVSGDHQFLKSDLVSFGLLASGS
jgi:Flp pilus assembly pilin Flp